MNEKYRSPIKDRTKSITLRISDFDQTEKPDTLGHDHGQKKVFAIEGKVRRRVSERIYTKKFSEEGEREGRQLQRRLQNGEDINWADETISGEALGYVIQQVGENIPASIVPGPMLVTDSPALNGNSLESLYEYAKRRPDRHGESPIAYVRRRAGLVLTTEDVIGGFDLGINLLWKRIPQHIRHDLLERAATERKKPAKEFEEPDFQHNYNFLNGKNLMRVLQQGNLDKQRTGMDIIPYILMNAGFTRYDPEEMSSEMAARHEIRWPQVPTETHLYLLTEGAREHGIKPYEMSFSKMSQDFDFLIGANLDKQYQYFQDHPDRGDRDVMEFIFQTTHMEQVVIDEIRNDEPVSWEKVPSGIVREILRKASSIRRKAAYKFTEADFLKKYAFLNGRSLESLYRYAESTKAAPEDDTLKVIFEKAEIGKLLREDIQKGTTIRWPEVHKVATKYVVDEAATRIDGGTHPRLVQKDELASTKFDFLGGRSLVGLTDFGYSLDAYKQAEGNITVIKALCDYLDIPAATDEDLAMALRKDRTIYFREHEPAAIKQLLLRAVTEAEKPRPISFITSRYLDEEPIPFLSDPENQRTLRKLRTFGDELANQSDPPQSAVSALKEYLHIAPPTKEDVIQGMSILRNFPWRDVPEHVIREVIKDAATELQLKPFAFYKEDYFNEPLNLLHGRSLRSLYDYAYHDTTRGEKQVGQFLFEKIGMVEEIIASKRNAEQIDWEEVPTYLTQAIITKALEEHEDITVKTMVGLEFMRPYAFLNGKNLSDIFDFATRLNNRKRERFSYPISALREYLGISIDASDMIDAIAGGHNEFWQELPPTAKYTILENAAQELGTAPSKVTAAALSATPFAFIEGKTLGIFSRHLRETSPSSTFPPFHEICRQGGHIPTDINDILSLYKYKIEIPEDAIADETKQKLLSLVALQLQKPATHLTMQDIATTVVGKKDKATLYPLYASHVQRNAPEGTTGLSLLKQAVDVSPHTPNNKQRRDRIDAEYSKIFGDSTVPQATDTDKIDAFVKAAMLRYPREITHLQTLRGYNTTRLTRKILTTLERANTDAPEKAKEVIYGVLEDEYKESVLRHYRDSMIDIPLTANGTVTLLDAVNYEPTRKRRTARTIYHAQLQVAYRYLTPIQRDVLDGIYRRIATLDELVPTLREKYGTHVTTEYIEETLTDTKVILLKRSEELKKAA